MKRSSVTSLFLVTLMMMASLAACGGGGGGAGAGETSFGVTSTIPADGAIDAVPLQNMAVVFSNSVLSSTVNEETIVVTEEGKIYAWPVTIAYDDASRTVTVTPRRPLSNGKTYAISITGVTDRAGNIITGASVSFTVCRIYTRSSVLYDDCCGNRILGHRDYTYDSNGGMTRSVWHYDPGTDKIWFTSDDTVGEYQDATYDANGSMTHSVWYGEFGDPGPDGIWFTSDDPVISYQDNSFDSNGNMTRSVQYFDPGTDGTWFNNDDFVLSEELFFT